MIYSYQCSAKTNSSKDLGKKFGKEGKTSGSCESTMSPSVSNPLPSAPHTKKICNKPCEVYSRVVGYFRPVQAWNDGKREEFDLRKEYKVKL